MSKFLLLLILYLIGPVCMAQNSIFSEGEWFKIGMTKAGLYKLDRSFLSGELGINVNQLDPRTLKVYGANGGMLPQLNSAFRYNDPPENTVLAVGTDDGTMDEGDYLLFYAEGPDRMDFDNEGNLIYEKNLYSDTSYYFITYGGDPGRRIQQVPDNQQNGTPITHFHDFVIHEPDDVNLQGSGRFWFGDEFSNQGSFSRTYSYEVPGLGDSVAIYLDLVTESEGPSSFDISFNDQLLANIPFDAIPSGPGTTYSIKGREKQNTYTVTGLTGGSLDLIIEFNRADALLSRGYLDYFVLTFKRALSLYGNSTIFRNQMAFNGLFRYEIDLNAIEDARIFNITDPVNVEEMEYDKVGSKAVFNHLSSKVDQFMVWRGSDFPSPASFGKVGNQNIKSSTQFDAVIITAAPFLGQAERLRDFHQSHDQLSVRVVSVDQVYNEFSSGKQDPTAIRDYIRYCYENGNRLKYVLLFGDCSYDYKNKVSNVNFIPVYESREVFSPIYSYSSDDYFGFLEEDEGEWVENTQGDHTMEVGVGRIPSQTTEEAKTAVDKIIRYSTSRRTLGKWRNEMVYVSDDGDNNTHMRHAVTLSNYVNDEQPQYRSKKLFLDNFEQTLVPRETSPQAAKALEDAVADGALVLSFIGHGNEIQWTDEAILTTATISNFTNRHKMPLFVTATCEFGRYDDPIGSSGAEQLLFHPNGGAIALVTTTRPVFAHTNLLVNQAFHTSLLSKEEGEYPRLGDIIRATKNNSLSGPVNRNFALLGDPMLRLNYPKYDILFHDLEVENDTLSALEKYTMRGAIVNGADTVSHFQGKATVSVLDIPQEKITKGQENPKFSYQEFSNHLFRGDVSVTDGLFESTFILPKNISYKLEQGKINVYAWDEDNFMDASGANTRVIIGGTSPNIEEDVLPPSIDLYINDASFAQGDVVGPGSLLIAEIEDESGINISSNGFNQSITLTLNGEEPVVLNDFYTAVLDSYQQGRIVYPLLNMEPGPYKATLKVWDTHNNSSTKSVEFRVSDQPRIRLYNVMNYPNPVYLGSGTTFSFEHDRQGEELQVKIEVYDLMGTLKFNSEFLIDDSLPKVDGLVWNVTNNEGSPLSQGVYLYKLQVSSTLDGARSVMINRLLVFN